MLSMLNIFGVIHVIRPTITIIADDCLMRDAKFNNPDNIHR
jgi:hypothetical protein